MVFSFCVSTHKFFKITFEEFWTLIGLWIMITLPFTITFYSDYNKEKRMMSHYHNKTYDSLEGFVKEIFYYKKEPLNSKFSGNNIVFSVNNEKFVIKERTIGGENYKNIYNNIKNEIKLKICYLGDDIFILEQKDCK